MAEQKKLERWAEKLLDTGKRNNLISFKDTKASTAEVLFPETESIFGKCSVGHVFEVFDPKIADDDIDETDASGVPAEEASKPKKLTRDEYKDLYTPKIKSERYLLTFAQTPNPLTAVKNIAKKAQAMLDETGINVAHLAFGFLKWREKENSEVFYKAPLLLVHINLITGSVLDPIKIEVSDDDITVNPTFNFLLQAEYGLTLPEYEDGETLSAYYAKVAATVGKLGWEILDECKIGIFSFLKINMYEDLKNNSEQILTNNNVRALLDEPAISTPEASTEQQEKPVENPLIDLHTVVDADSSQIEAIEMAKSGKSFVLQGPPGTGKSQTITNIIAECMHDGKKVLFVSEKQAALNVVFDKLKKAGLADFCLELHSHKANKKAVIEELNRTLEVPKKAVSSMAEEQIRQKKEAQEKLDGYAAALHEKRDVIEKSLYQLFELHAAQRQFPEVKLPIRNIRAKGQTHLLRAVRLLEQYAEYIPSIGQDYHLNLWYGFNNPQINYDMRNRLKEDLKILVNGYKSLQTSTLRIKAKYETPELNYTDTIRWQAMLKFASQSDAIAPGLLTKAAFDTAMPHLARMQELSGTILSLRTALFEDFSEDFAGKYDGRDLYTKLAGQYNSFFSRAFGGEYKTLMVDLQLLSKKEGKLKYRDAVQAAELLMKLQAAEKEYEENESAISACLGPCYNGPYTDWEHVMADMKELEGYLQDDQASFYALAGMNKGAFLNAQDGFKADARELNDEIAAVEEAKERVSLLFTPETLDLDAGDYSKCIQKLEGCLDSIDRLGNWISFMDLLRQLKELELVEYVDTVIQRNIEAKDIAGAYRRLFYEQWIEVILFSVPELAAFTRITQDQAVRNFVNKDDLQYQISKAQINAELSQLRPELDLVAGGSAVSILRREGAKKRKQMPIRKLLAETAGLVQILKPCFLMSPLSVSTFLDPEKLRFDTVVFDEASQIFPQDAVGAIYRGKQLIVVGDTRQMPPSNFFSSTMDVEDDDEEIGDVADFESILDICSSVFDTKRLAWHYRSHYEPLIAFSNLHFYNNHLVTFPSSSRDQKGIGVDYFFVDGTFDRKSKTNRIEAEFIVDLIFKNIDEYPDRSLGVVAFSVAQQEMIDKLLSKRREADPSYEWFFKADQPEPFFIKNLETVQGDERDTIIFSVAYAKDSQGRFIQNFGPINREGGERRLNVAVTRAKDNVQLVASIHYTDIDISKTESQGVKLLRAYLDYAQNGEAAMESAVNVSDEDRFDSDLEIEICEFLRDQGFTVDAQIGCSGYKIDLGLRKPNSSDYLLAIECDGATYHSSKNARDRDSLRQRVLENMGWQFYRIWSTDWYRNKAVEKERLLQAVHYALDNPVKKNKVTRQAAIEQQQASVTEHYVREIEQHSSVFPKYIEVDALDVFEKHHYKFPVAIRDILQTEAPLSEEYLLKRIVSLFDREKVTNVVINEFNLQMSNYVRYGIIRNNGFMYLKGQTEFKLRIPGVKRDVKYIALEELADGLRELVQQNVSISKDGLYRLLCNLLGFSRLGENIVARFDEALAILLKAETVRADDSIISVKDSPAISPITAETSEKNSGAEGNGKRLTKNQDVNKDDNPEKTQRVAAKRTPAEKKVIDAALECIEYGSYSQKELIEALMDDGFSRAKAVYGATNCDVDWNEQAVKKAKEHLSAYPHSYGEIVSWLVEDEFTQAEAKYGADHCGADWKEQAVKKAKEYLLSYPHSYRELVSWLVEDKFTIAEAKYGVDHCGADWKEQAVKKAKEYLLSYPHSYGELVSWLVDDKFTQAEAKYGVDHCGADWEEQAVRKAKEYLSTNAHSYKELVSWLVIDKFTKAEATYGVDHCGADWKEQAIRKAKERQEYSKWSYEDLVKRLISDGFTLEEANYGARSVT